MSAVKFFLLAVASVCVCSSYASAEEVTERKVICYFNNVAKYRKDEGKFIVDDIPGFCTHLVYSYARLDENHQIVPSDPDGDQFSFKRFTALREKYPKVKFMISVNKKGGSFWFSLAQDAEIRKRYYENVLKFLREHNFDGMEIDVHQFEFGEDLKYFDPSIYGNFCKDVMEMFMKEAEMSGRERLLFSIVLPEVFDFNFNVGFLDDHVDWMGITEYIRKPTDKPLLRHFSPLYAPEHSSVNRTVSYYLSHGASPSKVAMAVPFFGKSYQLTDPSTFSLGAEAKGKGMAGPYTLVDGYMAYFEICKKIKDEGWTVVDTEEKDHGPFAYKGDQWVSFDDMKAVMRKVDYAIEKKLGAIMLLTLDLDDFRGYCHGMPFPLSSTVVERFLKV